MNFVGLGLALIIMALMFSLGRHIDRSFASLTKTKPHKNETLCQKTQEAARDLTQALQGEQPPLTSAKS